MEFGTEQLNLDISQPEMPTESACPEKGVYFWPARLDSVKARYSQFGAELHSATPTLSQFIDPYSRFGAELHSAIPTLSQFGAELQPETDLSQCIP